MTESGLPQGASLERCRHCGTPTKQRAEGIPYCSMDCIGARRREKNKEHLRCPYPGCEWETDWLPDNGLSKGIAMKEAEEHRQEHAGGEC